MADETWNTTTYQCYVCGSYLLQSSTTGEYKCPHCGIIQWGTPIQRFGSENTDV
jgi:predicted RNA-binding Zn-ribbon protein involved in translation (DUF1610 family)